MFNSETNDYISSDPTRRAAFRQRLSEWPDERIRLPLSTILQVFDEEFPHRPRETEHRHWVLEAIKDAERFNIIRLPVDKNKAWDSTQHPPLPTYVNRIVIPKAPLVRGWKTYPWRPELGWIRDLAQLSPDDEWFLHKVHDGLVYGWFNHLETLKHRSWQLTRNEKRLSVLRKGVLFLEGRLTLDMIGCVPSYPPLHWEEVTKGDDEAGRILIFENVDLIWVALQVLRGLPHPPYNVVAVGYGYQLTQSIQDLKRFPRPIERVDYVGDIDHRGMHIALLVSRRMQQLGLPALNPAPGIHQKMLDAAADHGVPLGNPNTSGGLETDRGLTQTNEELVDWLPPSLHAPVQQILSANNRVAEESLSSERLKSLWQ